MKGLKKVLALVLSLAMVFGTLTVTALADEAIELGTLQEVVDALGSNTRESLGTKTYKLTANISVGTSAAGGSNLYVLGDEDITLDLAGYRLRSLSFRNFIAVQGGGTFTLIDSVGGGSLEAYYNATSSSTSTSRAVYLTGEGSTFNLVSGTVKSYVTNGTYDGFTKTSTLKGNLIYAADGTTFNMTGGTVTELPPLATTSTTGGMIYLGNGTHTISGGTISNGISSSGGNILLNKGTLTISGDDTLVTGGTARYGGNIRANDGSTLIINGGTISNGVSTTFFGNGPSGGNIYCTAGSAVVINGGTFSGSTTTNNDYYNYFKGTATINGGTFDGVLRSGTDVVINGGVFLGNMIKEPNFGFTVNGGWFTAQQPTDITTLGEGKVATGECANTPNAAAPYTVVDSEEYTVTYKLPDGTDIDSQVGTHGSKVEIINYTPASGTFGGWYYDAELTELAPAAGEEAEFDTDITLYAWVSAVTLHEVTVNIDGVENAALSGTYAEGSTFALPAAADKGEFFTFDGYSLTEGGEIEYQTGDEYIVTESGTIDFYTNYTEATRLASLATDEGTTYAHSAAELSDMVEAATEDTVITILQDFELSARINTVSGKTAGMTYFTFDFNGHTLHYTASSRGFINARAYSTFTITDSVGGGGVFFESPYATKTLVYSNTNTAITIDSGTYTGNYTEVSNALTNGNPNARTNLTGGVYSIDPSDYVQDKGAYEVVADTPTEGLYTVQHREEIIYAATLTVGDEDPVGYTRYEDALTAASEVTEENAVIVLDVLGDATDSSMNVGVKPGSTFTIDLHEHTLTRTVSTRAFSFRGVTATVKNGTYVAPSSSYTAGDGAFARIYSDDDGNASTVTFEDLNLTGFSASVSGTTKRNGGAVLLSDASTLNMIRGTVSNCHADGNGGFIHASGESTINVTGTTFTGNNASGNGGLFYTTLCTLNITGATISGNYATGTAGNMYLRSTAAVFDGVTLTGRNNAETPDGNLVGGVLLERNSGTRSTLVAKNGTSFADLYANTDGGAIYVSGECELTMDASTSITNCHAGRGGGAIYVGAANQGTATAAYGIANIYGTISESTSAGTQKEEVRTQPVWSIGFVYIDDVLTCEGATVYQSTTAAKFVGAAGAVSNTVTAKFFALLAPATVSTGDMSFTCEDNGTVTTLEGVYDSATGYYSVEVTENINRIADALTLTIYEGETIRTSKTGYSVLDYMNDAYSQATDAQKTLMANLIVFAEALLEGSFLEEGEAAIPGTAITEPEWVAEAKTTNAPTATYTKATVTSTTNPADYKVKSAILNIAEKIAPAFKINTLEGGSVKIKIGGEYVAIEAFDEEGATFDSETMTMTFSQQYEGIYVRAVRVSPVDYDSQIVVELYTAEGALAHSVRYSVNAYCVSMAAKEGTANVCTAIYNYGTAAVAAQ